MTLEQARELAGYSLDQAAKRAGVTTSYLRRIERSGGCSFLLAQRLARLYGTSIDIFLGVQTARTKTKKGPMEPGR